MKKYIEVLIVDTNGVDEKVMFLGDLHEFLTKFENSKVIALQKDNDTVYWNTTNIVGFKIIKEGEINDSITNVLGAYKNKEQAEQEVMLNKKKDDINFRSSKIVYEIQSFEVL